MRGRNSGYINKKTQRYFEDSSLEDCIIQLMTDIICMVLADEDILGEKVFSREEIETVVNNCGLYYDYYRLALRKEAESDVRQDKLDNKLRAIFKEDLVEFKDRYPFIKLETY